MSWSFALALVAASAGLAGCSRSSDVSFVLAAETTQLPEGHRTQIRDYLTKHFGTPPNPRFRVQSAEKAADGGEVSEDVVALDRLQRGAAVFNRRCAGCHGVTGDGLGEAAPYLQPKPRDYRRGVFKFTSTPYGAKPKRTDIINIIRKGAKGTSMPGFKFLSDEDLQAVTDYVIMLSHRGELERSVAQVASIDYGPEEPIEESEFADALARIRNAWNQAAYQMVLPVTAQPKLSDETILAGRKAFLSKGCAQCHGTDFRGQTEWLTPDFIASQQAKPEAERTKINFDAWGNPAPAADLTAGMLHGGRRPIDIYRRIYSGINGTPMPAFGQALAAEPEVVWNLVHYVLSVAEKREVPGLKDVVADPVAPSKER